MFHDQVKNSNVTFHCDNEAVVYIVNKKSANDPLLMHLLRKVIMLSFTNNIQVRAQHVTGALNVFADLISWGRLQEFLRLHPSVYPEGEVVSDCSLPENYVIPQHIWCRR